MRISISNDSWGKTTQNELFPFAFILLKMLVSKPNLIKENCAANQVTKLNLGITYVEEL